MGWNATSHEGTPPLDHPCWTSMLPGCPPTLYVMQSASSIMWRSSMVMPCAFMVVWISSTIVLRAASAAMERGDRHGCGRLVRAVPSGRLLLA